MAPATPNSCLFSLTSNPSIAVGPIGESLLLPKIAYTNGPTIDEYRPKKDSCKKRLKFLIEHPGNVFRD